MRRAFELRGFEPDCDSRLVGDRIDADVHAAEEIAVDCALVLSGVTGRADAERLDPRPTFVLESIALLPEALEGGGF